jgi:hypothetical protein
LETYLQGCDSDRKRYLLNGFINGFSLEYAGPRNSYNCYNLKSAKDKPEVVQEQIDKEVVYLKKNYVLYFNPLLYKRTNNDLQNMHIKLKIEKHELHLKPGANTCAQKR